MCGMTFHLRERFLNTQCRRKLLGVVGRLFTDLNEKCFRIIVYSNFYACFKLNWCEMLVPSGRNTSIRSDASCVNLVFEYDHLLRIVENVCKVCFTFLLDMIVLRYTCDLILVVFPGNGPVFRATTRHTHASSLNVCSSRTENWQQAERLCNTSPFILRGKRA